MKNVIWFANINKIGGVESVIWNVIRKYDRDITIWYDYADPFQLARYSKYVDLIKFNNNQLIECDNLIINYGYDKIEGHFKAKRVIYLVHANYKYLVDNKVNGTNVVTDPRFEYYAVSKFAADMYYEVSGIRPKVCYNPITIDDNRDALLIVSATRLHTDKGKLIERMETLANALDDHNVPFIWLVFTNNTKEKVNNKSVISVPSRLDILPFLKRADFVAQLSDSEAFCMTALETATLGTPLLLTKIPSFIEMGLNDENAIYFDFDMSNVNECVEKMISKKFNFTYTPKKDIWDELLEKGKKERKQKPIMPIYVKATSASKDHSLSITELDRIAEPGDKFFVSEDRYKVLTGDNAYGLCFVEKIPVDENPNIVVKKLNIETKEEPKVEEVKGATLEDKPKKKTTKKK